jgi:putative ABC transport system substrate-binding protein
MLLSRHTRRREFITLLGGAVAWPLAARAQQPGKLPTIGFLGSTTPAAQSQLTAAFVQRLRELGWIEARTVAIEYRWAEGRSERFAEFAAEFVRLKVDVILTHNTPPVLAAKQVTSVIPIVFATAADPVGTGVVASLARPGGNVTGLSLLLTELGPKQLEILHELVPSARRIALLVNPNNPNADTLSRELATAARILGLEIHVLHASSGRELDAVFATMHDLRIAGLVIGTDALLTSYSQQLAQLAADHSLPSIHTDRHWPPDQGAEWARV